MAVIFFSDDFLYGLVFAFVALPSKNLTRVRGFAQRCLHWGLDWINVFGPGQAIDMASMLLSGGLYQTEVSEAIADWETNAFGGPGTEVGYTWDVPKMPEIQCEPYPVQCIFPLKQVNKMFSSCMVERKWVYILHPGDNVWNGVFIPTVIYGEEDPAEAIGASYSNQEVATAIE